MITICVPVVKRYDLLGDLVRSLTTSLMMPTALSIIDNGQRPDKIMEVMRVPLPINIYVHEPERPMGVAESWNWFIAHVREERIIANDDVTFSPESIQRIVETKGDFVSPLVGEAFSCFLLRDSCVKKVGLFDETISPGYAYFEDCDYSGRMVEEGLRITHVDAGVLHRRSQTLAARSEKEMLDHHRKFMIAQNNYIRKWGVLPDGMELQRYG